MIRALEGIDRGWYAGPVGWIDANEDGEFCVALRCASSRAGARCYAGGGIVANSDPASELAETEVKLGALRRPGSRAPAPTPPRNATSAARSVRTSISVACAGAAQAANAARRGCGRLT